MTIHLNKYEILISDPIENVVNIKLFRKSIFGLYKSKLYEIVIELKDTHKYPFPQLVCQSWKPSYRTMGTNRKSYYIDHSDNYKDNLNEYIKILEDNSFELNVLPEGFNFNYKSYYREERLKKIINF